MTESATVVERRIDGAKVAAVEVVRVASVRVAIDRRSRPIVAGVADMVDIAIAAAV